MAENDIAGKDVCGVAKEVAGLASQSLDDLKDIDSINPLSPQVISRQATINVGSIGHVAHGKSTVVNAISAVKTTRFKEEAKKGITMHLGYANAKVFRCPQCPAPKCYQSFGSKQPDATKCAECGTLMSLERHFSFVDCPGHDMLMTTMLNGAAIMDCSLLLVAANEAFPQPQTLEHLKAVEIMRMQHVLVLQNKIDLVTDTTAKDQQVKIIEKIKNTSALGAPVIPISAQMRQNIDFVLEHLCHVPVPRRNLKVPVRMIIVRSFDVNKPGLTIDQLSGGVAGGTIQQGVLRTGALLEIRPGEPKKDEEGTYRPYRTRAVSINSEAVPLVYAIAGGLIGVGTTLDPSLTRQNKMAGQVLGEPSSMPPIFSELEMQFTLLPQVLGAKDAGGAAAAASSTGGVDSLRLEEKLQVNVGSITTLGTVKAVTASSARLVLSKPMCASPGDSVAFSRKIGESWRLIGWGSIRRGVSMKVDPFL